MTSTKRLSAGNIVAGADEQLTPSTVPTGPSDSTQRIAVVYRRLDALKPYARNARIHNRDQIKKLAASIKAFGFIAPVVTDRDDNVVVGHGRILGAKEAGITEVPTIRLEHLTETQIQAYRIADNRLSEIASWDEQLLAEELKGLSAAELNFSIEATGFSLPEIDFRIQGLNDVPDDDPADVVPEVKGPAVTKPGDLWLLGPHRLYCGNALEASSYEALMAGEKAAMVFSDAPYNVAIQGHASGLGATKHREFAMASGEMSSAEFTTFLATAFKHLAANSVDGSLHFLTMDWRHLRELIAAGDAAYSELKALCVWVKDNGGMGSLYRSQHELVFVYKAGTRPHLNNVQLGKFGRYRTNVWHYPGANTLSRQGKEGNLLALHPTVKPTKLVEDAILDVSNRGDIVLDAFLGSGTTILAAERTGRRGYGLELDPLYVDTAIQRWQTLTRQPARQASSGKAFGELSLKKE